MSRYAEGGGNALAATMLNNIATKEAQYKEGIRANHAMVKGTARRILRLEQELPGFNIMEQDKLDSFLNERKQSILQLAETNVQQDRTVNAFCSALQTVKAQVQNGQHANGTEYQQAIDSAMNSALNSDDHLQIKQEKMYLDVAETMGLSTAAKGDDDIEVVPTQTAQASSLKCPITGVFMEDAVKNKVCKHVYSRHGIEAHIRTATKRNRNGSVYCQCPRSGCTNQSVTMDQVEDDPETIMDVRREKRREASRIEQQVSQANDLIDSDEE